MLSESDLSASEFRDSTAKGTGNAGGPAFLPLLLILFLGSGCSALIYEIVWFQLLEFAVGSSAVSLGVLLATFMGGLCLGSLLFSRVIPRGWHPLRAYAFLELGIGVLGLLITWGMPWFDSLYATIGHGAGSGVFLRAVVCALCLLPPTLLMGATLPAISRWIETTPRGVSWLGFFYGGNTVGAVVGCLLAGFYLLRHFDMSTSTYVAAALNLVVAALGIAISIGAPYAAPPKIVTSILAPVDRLRAVSTASVYLAIALSGMAALGAEVIWTRLLSLLLGATVYTFSIILAVFLVGLGAGSSLGAMMARAGSSARHALGWCQALCALGIGWAAYSVTNALPHWPVESALTVGMGNQHRFELDLARCAWAILPATLCWGASFPLALAAVVAMHPDRDPAKAVGRVYAANTVGAILGALYFSLISVKNFGTQGSQYALVLIAGLAAVVAMVPGFLPRRGELDFKWATSVLHTGIGLAMALVFALGCVGVLQYYQLAAVPWHLIAWGRRTPSLQLDPTRANYDPTEKIFAGEGMTSSVAVTRDPSSFPPALQFHVAGKVEASTLPVDMRLQLMLGHFPAMFHAKSKLPDDRRAERELRVLIVGCGAGVTAGSFILHDHERIVICEIEPLVPQVVATYFGPQNNFVVSRDSKGNLIDNAVDIQYDDARHFILTTDEKFDIITSDPIHPWVKGAACLYTREYFELVKKHLNPGGIVTQWVPLYESSTDVVKSEVKTFFEAFPNGTVWLNNDEAGGGYDSILMGSLEPLEIDPKALQKQLDMVGTAGVLNPVGIKTVGDVLATYGGSAQDLADWTRDGETNHDSNLRLQYLAGEALNRFDATAIRNEMLRYRTFPARMIKVNEMEQEAIERRWGAPR
ncbi:MAG TPA: fused MFS/spermidine synthase [Phycisphaerae bacterium]|nr:fused MFS/spermidine synthase [Phycisphaerae bacterium]